MDIRTGVLPERAVCQVGDSQSDADSQDGTNPGGVWIMHTLPGDFWRPRSGGVRKLDGQNRPAPFNQYQLIGKKSVLTPPGRYLIEYDRYPEQLPANPNDHYNLDEDPEVIQAACLYAAAMLAAREDETLYSALYNAYESRLTRMIPAPAAEVRIVQDVYAF